MAKCKYPAKKWKRKIERYWKALNIIEDKFYTSVHDLERVMEKETGIKGIEFIWSDGEIIGIGNGSRTMELIHRNWREI